VFAGALAFRFFSYAGEYGTRFNEGNSWLSYIRRGYRETGIRTATEKGRAMAWLHPRYSLN
jgi:hypothetical protein